MDTRLHVTDPTTFPDYYPILWAALAAVGAILCLTPAWGKVQVLGTLVHEVGHGLGGLFAGRKFNSLTLHPDASGVTYTTGAGNLGLMFCFWSGYSAPGTTAVILAAVLAAGVANWFLFLLFGLMILCLIRARSVFTLLVLLGTATAAFTLWWLNNQIAQTAILAALAGFLLMAGFKHIHEAWRARKEDGGEADADALAELSHLPEGFWLGAFHFHTGICVGLSACLMAAPFVLA